MSKMSRLLRGELNKILMRPILYILTGVIVIALIFSALLLNMSNRGDQLYHIDGGNKTEVMINFSSAPNMNKTIAETMVLNAYGQLEYYQNINTSPETTVTTRLKNLIDNSESRRGARRLLNDYLTGIQYAQNPENPSNVRELNNIRLEMVEVLNEARTIISEAATSTNASILMPKESFENYITLISDALLYLNAEGADINLIETHENIYNHISQANGFTNIEGASYFDKLYYLTSNDITDITLSEETITNLNNQYEKVTTFMSSTLENINAYSADENISTGTLKEEILKYYYAASQYSTLVSDSIYFEPVKSFNDSYAHQFIGYTDVHLYQIQERIATNNYLLSNDLTSNQFSSVFTPTMSSGDQVGAFDLVYFGLEICSFIILIFCVVLAAGMIAGEQSTGTLKVLATRPYSRNKILTSKILASLIFGIIFLVFSAIVLFIIGYAVYGLDTTPILAVFNATSVFVISPFLLILIYLALLIVKILFYVLLATMISTVFRSNVGAVVISIFIYFLTAIFAVLFTSSTWYAFLPFAGIDFFKFFGGAFASDLSNPLSIAFSSPMFYNSSLLISAIVVTVTMVVMTILSYVVFKKREIK